MVLFSSVYIQLSLYLYIIPIFSCSSQSRFTYYTQSTYPYLLLPLSSSSISIFSLPSHSIISYLLVSVVEFIPLSPPPHHSSLSHPSFPPSFPPSSSTSPNLPILSTDPPSPFTPPPPPPYFPPTTTRTNDSLSKWFWGCTR